MQKLTWTTDDPKATKIMLLNAYLDFYLIYIYILKRVFIIIFKTKKFKNSTSVLSQCEFNIILDLL